MNNNIIEYLFQLLLSLSKEKSLFLEKELLLNSSYPSTAEIIELANRSKICDFLDDEPDLYTLEDGKPI
jgi:hypothetical protein